MQHILQYRPTIGINGVDTDLLGDEDPLFADDSGNVMQNPLLSAAEETKDREWRTFQANAGATIKLLKGLTSVTQLVCAIRLVVMIFFTVISP